ncbi:DNA-binding SARP family transcriptional activator [Tamaricihabitans halophyticus]|uniref:DNA-binding SARP family transcriptional activator n=1 Tax=Tamaricihabitans halophyticus TaxID=1262583 RepID=A0A4R2QX71_9PSEU|nr:tetratricopeptide repeat protein [Tamaricihabitans halophyticus]TCP53578.1 DNA-binding SARP family transcriptional activator [Tamaricihabitans halophyticus]
MVRGPGRLGERIREFRSRAELTQQKTADLAGMSVASLRDLEQGRVVRPRASTIRRLADTLALSRTETDELLRIGLGDTQLSTGPTIDVLGPLRVIVDGQVVDPGSETQRALLCLLALSPNVSVSKETLVEVLWGEYPPATAADLLQTRMSRLRRRLQPARSSDEAPMITATRGGYQLTAIDEQVDLLQFRRSVSRARQSRQNGDLVAACEQFQDAVRHWRGEPLTEVPVIRGLPAATALVQDYRAVAVEYATVAAELGRHEDVLPLLQDAARAEPLHEAVHAALMIALAGCGQQASAMSTYARIRERLVDELGADPGPVLVEANQRIMRHEVLKAELAPVTAHRQIPADTEEFSGREPELRALQEQLIERGEQHRTGRIAVIEGSGGVGKTKLAVRFAHQQLAAGRFADIQLYVDLHGHSDQPPAEPAAVLAAFLQLLDVTGGQIPADIAGRAALYRDRLYAKNALIIMDNAANEEQVQPLLPAGPANLVLVTSRRTLAVDGAYTMPIPVFSGEEAERLLRRIVGDRRVSAEPTAAQRVVTLCGHLPLAIALAVRRLQARSSWTFADLADRLAESSDRLTELAAGSRQLRSVFDLSYQALSSDEQRVFRLLALCPGDDLDATAMAVLADIRPNRAQRLLDRLVDEYLLDTSSGDRYHPHDLVREYASQLVAAFESAPERTAATTRLVEYYLHATDRAVQLLKQTRWRAQLVGHASPSVPAFSTPQAATSWLEANRAAVTTSVGLAVEHGLPTHAWQLAQTIRVYLQLHGQTQDWVQTHQVALNASIEAGDLVGEAVTRTFLGAAMIYQSQPHLAVEHLDRALELHKSNGERHLEMSTLGWLANVYYRLGKFEKALDYNMRAAPLVGSNEPDMHREVRIRNNAGLLLATLGRFPEALDNYQRALDVARQSDLTDSEGESVALANMGDSYRQLGRHDEALEILRRALRIAMERGQLPQQAYVRHRLGLAYRDHGLVEQALPQLAEAREVIGRVHAPVTECEILTELGDTYRVGGELDQAREYLRGALAMAVETRERRLEARALEAVGELHYVRGDTAFAQDHWQQAYALYVELGVAGADRVRRRLVGQADTGASG